MSGYCTDEVDTIDVSEFGGEQMGPILLDHVRCSGEESDLLQCDHSMVHTCSHSDDVGIICHCKYY